MSLAKKSEFDYEGVDLPFIEEVSLNEGFIDDSFLMVDEAEIEGAEHLSDDQQLLNDEHALHHEESPMLVFELPAVPGGEYQDEIEDPSDLEVEEKIEEINDPWKWTVNGFLEWLHARMQGIPRHSGRDSAGLERAISYLEQLDKEISRAARLDLNNEIAIDAMEKARDEIHKGLDRLYDRLEKVRSKKYPKRKGKNKKASIDNDITKEASKGAYYGAVTVTIPIFISGIARACINSMVSSGKDIEEEFKKLASQYDLDKREEFMLYQVLSDMGYHVRRPRGTELNEDVRRSSTENTGWIADYNG